MLKRNVYILSIVAFIVNLGFGAAMPLIPFLLLSYEGRLTDLPENLGKIEGAEAIAFQINFNGFGIHDYKGIICKIFWKIK